MKTETIPGNPIALFDGKTLTGWHAVPRAPVPSYPGAPGPDQDSPRYKEIMANKGRWFVEDGCIVGGRGPVDSEFGSYLLTDEVYGDFDLTFDITSDWPTDTGILVRATALGSQGYQIHYDYRPFGSIATICGNGIGMFRARQYAFDMTFHKDGKPQGLELKDVAEMRRQGLQHAGGPESLTYVGDPQDVMRAIRIDDWNTVRVRVTGAKPRITTWLNDVKVVELDAVSYQAENYDVERVADLLGSRGHIALEVHNDMAKDIPPEKGGGIPRWGHGALARWRNVVLTPL